MDNTPTHGSRDTRLHLLKTGQRTVPHPALSPDLSPCNFWLFPTIKKLLQGRRFRDLNAVEQAVSTQIGMIPAAEYCEAILKKWPMCWA